MKKPIISPFVKVSSKSKMDPKDIFRCTALADYVMCLMEMGDLPKEGGNIDGNKFLKCVDRDQELIQEDLKNKNF